MSTVSMHDPGALPLAVTEMRARMTNRHGLRPSTTEGRTSFVAGGSVEVYAIGTGDQFAAFRASLQRGPDFSRVSGVEEEPVPLEESYSKDFVIANTA